MRTVYMVFYMMEGFETDHQKVFASSAQEAADKIRERADVLDVFAVYLPVVEGWK